MKRVNCMKKNSSYKLRYETENHKKLIYFFNVFLLSNEFSFDMPEATGDYTFALYLMSDVYLGLDQQYEISFEVKENY